MRAIITLCNPYLVNRNVTLHNFNFQVNEFGANVIEEVIDKRTETSKYYYPVPMKRNKATRYGEHDFCEIKFLLDKERKL